MKGLATHLPQQPAAHPVPLYLGALTFSTVELAGELADGVMSFLWSTERVACGATWCARGRAKAAGRGKLEMTVGLPTFIGDNMAALMDGRCRRNCPGHPAALALDRSSSDKML